MKFRTLATATFVVGAAFAGAEVHAQPEALKHPQYVEPAPVYTPPAKRPDTHDVFVQVLKPSGETPRRADGHPDLSGAWDGIGFAAPTIIGFGSRRSNGTFEPDQVTLQRSSHYYKPLYRPEYWPKVRALDFSVIDTDPAYGCGPKGVPRQGAPMKIMQNDKEIMLMRDDIARIVPIGGKVLNEFDEDMATTRGISVARWEGDVLTIDSVGFSDETWLAWEGLFHSDRMKVTERLWRVGNVLYYNFTVTDPVVLIRPWTSQTQVILLNDKVGVVPPEALPCSNGNPRAVTDQFYRG